MKGFTIVELLVVLAILGSIALGLYSVKFSKDEYNKMAGTNYTAFQYMMLDRGAKAIRVLK